jgi:hypothetical protein
VIFDFLASPTLSAGPPTLGSIHPSVSQLTSNSSISARWLDAGGQPLSANAQLSATHVETWCRLLPCHGTHRTATTWPIDQISAIVGSFARINIRFSRTKSSEGGVFVAPHNNATIGNGCVSHRMVPPSYKLVYKPH